MSAYCPASDMEHSMMSKLSRVPFDVILYFIPCSLISRPSFIQATVAGGESTSASKEAEPDFSTVRELGNFLKVGANISSPGTWTTRLQLLKHSPTSLNALQVYVPASSGNTSWMTRLWRLPEDLYSKSLLGLISFSLWSQTTSNLSAGGPLMQVVRVTASPSVTVLDWTWSTTRGDWLAADALVPL